MDFMLRLPNCTDKHQMLIILTNPTSDIWILRLTKQTCWHDFGKTAQGEITYTFSGPFYILIHLLLWFNPASTLGCESNRPVAQNPSVHQSKLRQCTICTYVHISVKNGALWDICLMHCVNISSLGQTSTTGPFVFCMIRLISRYYYINLRIVYVFLLYWIYHTVIVSSMLLFFFFLSVTKKLSISFIGNHSMFCRVLKVKE